MFFKHFASKNQVPGFYVSRTLVEYELNISCVFSLDILSKQKILFFKILVIIQSIAILPPTVNCDLTEAWVALDKKGKNVAEILFFKKNQLLS